MPHAGSERLWSEKEVRERLIELELKLKSGEMSAKELSQLRRFRNLVADFDEARGEV